MSIMQRIAGAVHGPRIVRPAIAAAFAALCCLAGGLGAGGSVAVAQAAGACPNQALRTGASANLPDCRAYELVSPADKGSVSYVGDILPTQVEYQVAADGHGIVYPIAFGLPGASSGGAPRYRAARGTASWQSTLLTPPTLIPPGGASQETGNERYFSPDLSCGVLESIEPLTADTPASMVAADKTNLFRRDADGSYTLVSTLVPTNPNATNFTSPYAVVGVSSGCGRVVYESPYDYPGIGASGLYEWSGGSLHNVGVLPDDSVASGAHAGYNNGALSPMGSYWHAVSTDGSRIFFSAISDAGADSGKTALFLRKDGTSTVDVSQSQTAVADQGAFFQLASKSGDRVIFMANYGIASSSSAGPQNTNCTHTLGLVYNGDVEPCDLYSYDVDNGNLTDLSADSNSADTDGAMVAGVLGASADASYVYFAAEGQLVANRGRTYAQNTTADSFNVYLAHGSQLSFVGLLNKADLIDTPSGALIINSITPLNGWRSRVTPDGRHLLFSSTADVTGYDSGGVAEAYLYSAGADTTVCVSCRQDGLPSVGVAVGTGQSVRWTKPLPSGGAGFLDPLHPPRSLSDDGSRVFFTMPDVLAHGAVSGGINVYEWHDGRVDLLATATGTVTGDGSAGFEGASANGDDVFIVTDQQLTPQDQDHNTDVYDIRVGGGFPAPAAPAAPCVGAQCQGAVSAAPASKAPATAVFSGPGNVHPKSSAAVFHVRGIGARQRRRLAAGRRIGLRVRVSEPGRVRAAIHARFGRRHQRGRVRLVAHRTKRARRAGTVKLRVRLSRRARRYLNRHRRLRIAVKVRYSKVQGAQRARLTLRHSPARGSGGKHGRRARRARHDDNRSRGARR